MARGDIVYKTQDLTSLIWSENLHTSGTGGTFLKSRTGEGSRAVYYKLSCYDRYRGVFGHECVNELIAARLLSILGIAHANYRLVHARVVVDDTEFETWLNKCNSFRKTGEKKMPFDLFYDLYADKGEDPLLFCARYGWQERIHEMMLFDYLIANRDRHGANVEVLRDSKDGSFRLAPLFDNGLSLLFSCYDDADRVSQFDPLRDVNANNYFGSRSLERNLELISRGLLRNKLHESDKEVLLKGLDKVLSQAHLDKIWQIIWQRWCRYEAL